MDIDPMVWRSKAIGCEIISVVLPLKVARAGLQINLF